MDGQGVSFAKPLTVKPLLIYVMIISLFRPPAAQAEVAGPAPNTAEPISLSKADRDVARSILNVRLAMGDVAECNLYMLGLISQLLSREANNLMNYQGWVFNRLNAMAQQLHNIFSDMERLMPEAEGPERAAMEGMKAALSTAGLIPIPPMNVISFGASLTIQLGEAYAAWHNSDQAAGIAEGIKENARQQVEAFQGAVRIYNDIVQGLAEISRYQARIQGVLDTYEERCLNRQPIERDLNYVPSPVGTPHDLMEGAVNNAVQDLDDCDLARLVALNKFLTAQIDSLFGQLSRLFELLLLQSNQLNTVMGNLEQGLPQAPNLGWEGLKVGLGAMGLRGPLLQSTTSLSASLHAQVLDGLRGLDAVSTADALKRPVKAKMEELKQTLETHEAVLGTLNRVRTHQQRIQRLIETWEDRCYRPRDGAIGALPQDNAGRVQVAHDSPVWCTYTPGQPTSVPLESDGPRRTPVPIGGSVPRESDDPRDTPGSCEQELEQLRRYKERFGAELEQEANDLSSPLRAFQAAHDLNEVNERIAELEALCGQGSTPGETPPEQAVPTRPPVTTVPGTPEVPTVTIYVKAKAVVLAGDTGQSQSMAGQQVKLFAAAVITPALPGSGVPKPQTDHAQSPIQGTTDGNGNLIFSVPAAALGLQAAPGTPAYQVGMNTTPQSSCNVQVAGSDVQTATGNVPKAAQCYLTDATPINNSVFLTFMYPASMEGLMNRILVRIPGVVNIEVNFCRDKQKDLNDPYYAGKGSWGQAYDDQWAIKRVGLTGDNKSAWAKLGKSPQPVVVAVIDSGLDWHHLDFDWQNLWRNPGEVPDNGKDDDGNGYVDDIIGWDFMGQHNNPWDHDGHGTHVAGVIAASQDNETGMAGINPHARIMVLKAINNFGHTRASYLAKAIMYAVDNGARVVNMSVGGKNLSVIEKEAVKYAVSKGVLIVVASGNEGIDVGQFGPAGVDGVLTVAATGLDDTRAGFSNWGAQVGIAAPGIDVLGLRARRTDTMLDIPGVEYVAGGSFVGDDNRYYRGSGTSFAAPIVTGVASLVLSRYPELTGQQVARMLQQSATDIDVPGVDQYSGYGIVNAVAALETSPEFYVDSMISGVQVVQGRKGPEVQVLGTADADKFKGAALYIGQGESPTKWKKVVTLRKPVQNAVLGAIPATQFKGANVWIIQLITDHRSKAKREFRFRLNTG